MSQTIAQLAEDVRHLTARIPREVPLSPTATKVNPRFKVPTRPAARRGSVTKLDGQELRVSKIKSEMRRFEAMSEALDRKNGKVQESMAKLRALMEEIK